MELVILFNSSTQVQNHVSLTPVEALWHDIRHHEMNNSHLNNSHLFKNLTQYLRSNLHRKLTWKWV